MAQISSSHLSGLLWQFWLIGLNVDWVTTLLLLISPFSVFLCLQLPVFYIVLRFVFVPHVGSLQFGNLTLASLPSVTLPLPSAVSSTFSLFHMLRSAGFTGGFQQNQVQASSPLCHRVLG